MNIHSLNNVWKLSFMIFLFIFIASCNSSKNKDEWNEAMIDPDISETPIYGRLDQQKELFSVFEKQDSLMKRTSDVKYSTGKAMNPGEFDNLKINNCRAYYHQSDILSINIGIGNGFGGQGFIIKYKDKKFYTEPYFFTDVINPGEPEPTYKIVYQKLTLNKRDYKPGDSLYGHIDFKSIETDKNNNTMEHWGKGYFRARVMEL